VTVARIERSGAFSARLLETVAPGSTLVGRKIGQAPCGKTTQMSSVMSVSAVIISGAIDQCAAGWSA
jgi:hypothetical protein